MPHGVAAVSIRAIKALRLKIGALLAMDELRVSAWHSMCSKGVQSEVLQHEQCAPARAAGRFESSALWLGEFDNELLAIALAGGEFGLLAACARSGKHAMFLLHLVRQHIEMRA